MIGPSCLVEPSSAFVAVERTPRVIVWTRSKGNQLLNNRLEQKTHARYRIGLEVVAALIYSPSARASLNLTEGVAAFGRSFPWL